MKFWRLQRGYCAHLNPANAACNLIAVMLAFNGPFYPAYVIGLIGRPGLLSAWTMLASPFFYAVPWIGRRNALAGRLALPLIGTLNTFCCLKLFGAGSGVGYFFLPCIILPALLFRQGEAWPRLSLIGFAILPFLLPNTIYGAPLMRLAAAALLKLQGLNLFSVATLSGFIALQFAAVLRAHDLESSRLASNLQRSPTHGA